ncbi:interleukin-13 receptor subunit alpha-2-like [Hyperolius riggenbachi]|uniref:interleukin-13 receptor subunit alpha-2-like n=1 Tax=Hyperolius riggenbachi TaxID=752182 RepID=UPI0035A321BA
MWETDKHAFRSKSSQRLSKIMIYFMLYVQWAAALQTKVDPPSNIQVEDPGYLGILDISWQPPHSLNHSQCTPWYDIQHYDANEQWWKSARTRHYRYRAAFNLGEDIIIKMRTYLNGDCTDGKEVWSEWIQVNSTRTLQGNPKSKVKDFQCINDNFEVLRCTWKAGQLSNNSNYELQYWQEGMSKKKTCGNYLKTGVVSTGCLFGKEEFELFSDLFICVTGMPGMDLIRSSYFSFQLQNVGKPGIPEGVNISKTEADELILDWRPPNGKIPSHCLKYEIQYKDETDSLTTITDLRKTSYVITVFEPYQRLCVCVRTKTSKYCADDGYWSDWSLEKCLEEMNTVPDMNWIYCIVAAIVLLSCLFVVAVLYVVGKKKHWSEKIRHKAKELVY